MAPVGYGSNMVDVDVISSQTLSLREREIKYMIDNYSLRHIPTGQNLSLKSTNVTSTTTLDQLDAQQAPHVPWLVELKTFCDDASVGSRP